MWVAVWLYSAVYALGTFKAAHQEARVQSLLWRLRFIPYSWLYSLSQKTTRVMEVKGFTALSIAGLVALGLALVGWALFMPSAAWHDFTTQGSMINRIALNTMESLGLGTQVY